MNITIPRAFSLAVLANVIGGLIVIAFLATHARLRDGRWSVGDGI